MNKEQEDKLNMYQAADSVLQTNSAVWITNVPFSAAVTALEDGIDEIENKRDQQELNITGITEDKSNRRQKLEDDTYTMGNIIVFYASTSNNRELLKQVKFGRSELSKARDNELPGMADQVQAAAAANALALAPFGITPAMITTHQATIDDFVLYISKPRAALANTSAATEEIPSVFKDIDKILEEQLDMGMELYHVSDNDFYTTYFNSRIIVNSPTKTRALEVHVKDSISGKPIEHVKVNIDGTIHRRSSTLGNIRVQDLTEGTHHLEAIIDGHAIINIDFIVINGETTKLELSMVKI
jgi:hypothetical protein